MGLSGAGLVFLWLALSCAHGVEIIKGKERSHGHYVCSTWGNNHYKTFDGDVYQYPGTCDYNFASDCRETYKEFSVHIQRVGGMGHPQIDNVVITIKDVTILLKSHVVIVNGAIAKTPYYSFGVLIDKDDAYIKVYAKVGLVLMWNREDAVMLELDAKFNNSTCGLCGDYNGQQLYNEFISENQQYSPITFGNLQRVNRPNYECVDPEEAQGGTTCTQHRHECEKLLTHPAFADCQTRLNLETYIEACMQDMCTCNKNQDTFCLCSTISEYSRQCSHAGGHPANWRSDQFCPKECPKNMVYLESGSPCMNTCSHQDIRNLCEEHHMDGCFCPEGTVVDDLTGHGCVPVSECHCKLQGILYYPGQKIVNECEDCVCNSGQWVCKNLPCPGVCSVEGGSHISTFDGKKYTFHGDCYYVFSKGVTNGSHIILGELASCGSTHRQTCLKTVVLLTDNKKNMVSFQADGTVLLNEGKVAVPYVTASFSIVQPTSSNIIVQVSPDLQMQIQLKPVMQLYITMEQSARETLQGLCGNFNSKAQDDFKTASGLVEATASAFANTWKALPSCPDKPDWLDDPCSLNIESETYAEHWCSKLTNSESPFAKCHSAVDPAEYYKRCKYDTCNCKSSEDCMCAAISSYVRACAAKGIVLWGWRNGICVEGSCPASQIYLYNLTTCQPTCRSLNDRSQSCDADFVPLDGCGCPSGLYMTEKGHCVAESKCSCYHKGLYLLPGNIVFRQDELCTCRAGKLHCASVNYNDTCPPGKIYLDCSKLEPGSSVTPVQKTCQTRTSYFQTDCVSGCVCPAGLIDDGRGNCIPESQCPCIHNEEFHPDGSRISVDCNTCTCHSGHWSCTKTMCFGTCTIHGSGHYITFDGKQYNFDGNCEYVAAQDYCGKKNNSDSLRIVTENVPCGTTGVTCSKAIKVFLGNLQLKLEDKNITEIQGDGENGVQYLTREVGLYLVIQSSNGILLIWDTKTTIFIKLSPQFKGKVCGLCGNFDGDINNDFTTSSQVLVTNALEFGNSWKVNAYCPDVQNVILPCSVNPHRKSWAEKQCAIIKSPIFHICHNKVDPTPYYDACVHDSCSCDSGGDCECFCSAVAVYAQECTKERACVHWRTPDLCPIFCDFYNHMNICDWHYHPCGKDSLTTCRSLGGIYSNVTVTHLEGCYPTCPEDTPVFDETTRKCIPEEECGCVVDDKYYEPNQEVPTDEKCTSCICTKGPSVSCSYDETACFCLINGTRYEEGEVIYRKNESGFCIEVVCKNGTEVVEMTPCPTTSTTITTTSVTTPTTTTITTGHTSTTVPTTTCGYEYVCSWSPWFDVSTPHPGPDGGDFETYDQIRAKGHEICGAPHDIQCRSAAAPDVSLGELGQKLQCNVSFGLICRNQDQEPDESLWELCYDYEIRVNCCALVLCPSSTTPTTTKPTTTPKTTTETTTPTTTTPTTTSPTTTTTTPTTTPTTTTPITTTESTTYTTTTTPTTTTPTTTTESTTETTTPTTTTPTTTTEPTTTTPPIPTTSCPVVCHWTPWFDVSYPEYGANGGDFETYDKIREEGHEICGQPQNISCRSQHYPDIPIHQLGQKVHCDVSVGLTCKNSEQTDGPSLIPVCYNYEISVYCCEEICPTTPGTTTPTTTPITTTTTPTTTTTMTTTTETTTTTPWPPTTTTEQTSTPTTTTPTPTPTPTITTTTSTTTTTGPTSTTPIPTTSCPVVCLWTPWFDVSYPEYGAEGGDFETYDKIREDGHEICGQPQNISCRSQHYPDIPIHQLGQKVHCDVSVGLTCKNSEQTQGPSLVPVCYNYEISVYCCEEICPTTPGTTTPTTIPSTTTSTTTTTTTTPKTTTTTPTTTTPKTTTTTPTTTTGPTSTTLTSTTICTPGIQCEWTDWIDVDYPQFGPEGGDFETYDKIREHGIDICGRPENISCRAERFPDKPFEELQQQVTCDVRTGLICLNKDQSESTIIPMCYNYEIKVYCCREITCGPTTTHTTTTPGTTTTLCTTETPEPSIPTSTTTTFTESTTSTKQSTTPKITTTPTITTATTTERTTTSTKLTTTPGPPEEPTTLPPITTTQITTTESSTSTQETTTPPMTTTEEPTTSKPTTTTTTMASTTSTKETTPSTSTGKTTLTPTTTSPATTTERTTTTKMSTPPTTTTEEPTPTKRTSTTSTTTIESSTTTKETPTQTITSTEEPTTSATSTTTEGFTTTVRPPAPTTTEESTTSTLTTTTATSTTTTETTVPTTTEQTTTSTPTTTRESSTTTTTTPPTTTTEEPTTSTTTTTTPSTTTESTTTTQETTTPSTTTKGPTTTTPTITTTTKSSTSTTTKTTTPITTTEAPTTTPITTIMSTTTTKETTTPATTTEEPITSEPTITTESTATTKKTTPPTTTTKVPTPSQPTTITPTTTSESTTTTRKTTSPTTTMTEEPTTSTVTTITTTLSTTTTMRTTTPTTTEEPTSSEPTTTKPTTTPGSTTTTPTTTSTEETTTSSATTTIPTTTTESTTTTRKTTGPTTTTTEGSTPSEPTTTKPSTTTGSTTTTPTLTTTEEPTTSKPTTTTPTTTTESTTTTRKTTSPTTTTTEEPTTSTVTTTTPTTTTLSTTTIGITTPTTTEEPTSSEPTTTKPTTTTRSTTTTRKTTPTTTTTEEPTTPTPTTTILTTTTESTTTTRKTTSPTTTATVEPTPSEPTTTKPTTTTGSTTTTKKTAPTTTITEEPTTSTPTTSAPLTTTLSTITTEKTTTTTEESTTPAPTTTTGSTRTTTEPTTPSSTPSTICTPGIVCEWTEWIDVSYPEFTPEGGDFETFDEIRKHGIDICEAPENITCRAERFPDTPLEDLQQTVTCNASMGLICRNKDQFAVGFMPMCYNYQISVYCCREIPCGSTTTRTSTTQVTTTTPCPTETTEIWPPKPTTTTPPVTTTEVIPTTTTEKIETQTMTTVKTTPVTGPLGELTSTPEIASKTTTETTTTSTTTPTSITPITTTTSVTTPTTPTTTSPTTTTTPTTTETTTTVTTTPTSITPITTTTSVTTSTTPTTTSSTTITTPTTTETTTTVTTTIPSTTSITTICHCLHDGKIYFPGEMIYNGSSGNMCFAAYCNDYCDITYTDDWNCKSTTPATITETTTPVITSTSTATTTTTPTTTTPGITTSETMTPETTTPETTTPEITTTPATTTPTTTKTTTTSGNTTPETTTPEITTTPATTTPTTTKTTTTSETTTPETTTPEITTTTITTTPITTTTTSGTTTSETTTSEITTTPTTTTPTTTKTTTTSGTTTPETTTPEITTPTSTTTTTSGTTSPETTTPEMTTTPTTTTQTTTKTTTTSGTTTPETTTPEMTTTPATTTPTTTKTTTTSGTTTPEMTTPEITTTTITTTPITTTTTTTPGTTTPETTTSEITTTPTTSTPTTTKTTTTSGTTTPETTTSEISTTTITTTTTTTSGTTTPETTTSEITTTPTTTTPTTTKTTTTSGTTTPETTTPEITTPTTTTTTTSGTTTPETITPESTTTTITTTPTTTTSETTTPETTTPGITTTATSTTSTTTTPTTTIPRTTTPETTTPETTTPKTTTTGTTTKATTTSGTTTPETIPPDITTTTITTTPTTTTTTTTSGTTTPETTTSEITTTPTTTTPTTTKTTTTSGTTTPEMTTPEITTPTTTTTTTSGTTTPETTTSEITTTPTTTTPTTTKTTTTSGTTTPEMTTPEITTPTTTTTTTSGTTTPETITPARTTTTITTTPTTTTTTTTSETTTSETTTPGITTATSTTSTTTTPTTTTPRTTTPETTTPEMTTPKTTTTGTTTKETTTSRTTTTPKITTSKSTHPTTTPTTVPSTTKLPGCPFEPHREHNETWMLCNCTMARCLENNTVEIIELKCEPPPMIQCASGRPPVAVPDDDLCCWHWECDCLCTGWGDPHYKTFDGTYYSYQGNCTYVLVEEIQQTIDNFGVYIDNYHCDARDKVSCPRTIIVTHETQEVQIKSVSLAPIKVQVLVNKKIVSLPYKKYGVKIYQSGINYVVEIPELEANITYNGLAFSIKLPYRLFGNNTQGQCGTCTNNQLDDCRSRSGEILSNCEIMADSWIVHDPNKPHCRTQPITPPPLLKTTTSPCKYSPLCDIINGRTFQKCHGAIPPKDFFQACVFDSCNVPNTNIECASLQSYALLCADQGICVDWRSQVMESCPITCPSHKVYKPCGPAVEATCQDSEDDVGRTSQIMLEGCFCPDGTMLHEAGVEVCVEKCGCVGPDKVPRQFGEIFIFDCQDCICREGGSGIVCEEHKCIKQRNIACNEEGFYAVTQINPNDPCCNETVCRCDASLCTTQHPNCGLGFDAVGTIPEGKCCPVYQCVRKNVCVHGGAEYQPNSPVFSDKCQSCVCKASVNSTSVPSVSCEHVPCNVQCEAGFALKTDVKNECCGVCQQTHCVMKVDGVTKLLNPGETLPSETDNCTMYSCTKIRNQFITSTSHISCPRFYEEDCVPGTVELMPNGCCKVCIEQKTACEVKQFKDYISHNNCTSSEKVTVQQCEGSCGTYSMYSAKANSMAHKCTCCQELQTSERPVVLHCSDGTQVNHQYLFVEKCGCINTDCGLSSNKRARRDTHRLRRSKLNHSLP